QELALKCVLFLSLFATVGVLAGIVITEHQLLSPAKRAASKEKDHNALEDRKYLKEFLVDPAASIDAKRRDGTLTLDEAYKELLALVRKMEQQQKEGPDK